MLILPAHLAHMRPLRPSQYGFLRRLEAFRQKFAQGMLNFAGGVYRPFLQRCLGANMLVAAIFLVALSVSLALYGGGWVRSGFFPAVNADFAETEIILQEGGPYNNTLRVLHQVEQAAMKLKAEYNRIRASRVRSPPSVMCFPMAQRTR